MVLCPSAKCISLMFLVTRLVSQPRAAQASSSGKLGRGGRVSIAPTGQTSRGPEELTTVLVGATEIKVGAIFNPYTLQHPLSTPDVSESTQLASEGATTAMHF